MNIPNRDALGRIIGNPPVEIKCSWCNKSFFVGFTRKDTAKYCSKKCHYSSKKGVDLPQFVHIKGISNNTGRTHFKKGSVPWNDIGSENYSAIHKWLERNKEKKYSCQLCNDTKAKKYEFANLSGNYMRDQEDYLELCTSCHARFDKRLYKSWETRRHL